MDLVASFAAHQRLRGWSDATVTRRSGTLRMFAGTVALDRATVDDVEAFLAARKTAATRHAYRSDLRAFYSWAVDRGHVATDPTTRVAPIKVPRYLPRPLDATSLRDAIAAADPEMRLMLMLGAYAGLRCMEIANLRAEDIADGVLVVRGGKGGKDRAVPLHPALEGALAQMGHGGQVFPGATPDNVSRRVTRHLRAHGINATAHQLRHTFGTELARVTHGDLLVVGSVMGHASATTTLGYAKLAANQAAPAISQMFDVA